MYKLYFGLATGAFSLFGWLLSSDATRSASDSHYSFMFSPLAYFAYVTGVIGVVGVAGGLLSLRSARPLLLGADRLRRIMDISSNPDHMGADKHGLLSKYKKWVQIDGSVNYLDKRTGLTRLLVVQTCQPGLIARAQFSYADAFNSHLGVLQRGDQVTVIGKVKRIEDGTITLVRCKLAQ
jgi:hypothetical protein